MTAQPRERMHPKHLKANWPFYWISQVNAAYADVLERRIKHLGIDIPRWRAMISLYEEQYLSVSEIAEYSAQKLNTTTKVVQRMMNDGLVTTRIRPTDGRVTEVCLTPKGDKIRQAAMDEAWEVFDLVFSKIAAKQTEELNQLLSDILVQLRKL